MVPFLHAPFLHATSGALEKSLMTDADLVKATFRLWDVDGNGVVSKEERRVVLSHSMFV